jgi:FKBP-type peptidyl-prolyl cis-trans isomerase FklB
MKIKGLFALTAVIALLVSSCGTNSLKSAKLKTVNDTLSYAIASNIYNQLAVDSISLNPAIVAKAFIDSKNGKALMTEEEINAFMQAYVAKRQQVQTAKQAETNKVTYKEWIDKNTEYLAKNKDRAGVTVTPSGLQYEVIKMGTGAKPTAENTVKVHYVGTLIDSTEFDSSIKRNAPAEFPVSGIIPGWTEALQLMPVGSKFKLYLPESLAYGANGAGELIKPYSTLIFEVELLEIVK